MVSSADIGARVEAREDVAAVASPVHPRTSCPPIRIRGNSHGGGLAGANRTSGARNGDFDPGESVDLARGANVTTGTFTHLRPDGIGAVMPYSVSGGSICHFMGTLTSG